MRKRVRISLLCALLMVVGISTSASAGSYWTEGTYSGDYYEVYGVLKRSDVYSSGHYYGSSMGHASSSRTLKINTRVYTKFYGPEDDIINYDTTGKGSVSSNGNTRWPASYANYKYYINNANIKDIRVNP